MKKLTAFIMAALLTLSFAACGSSEISSTDNSKKRGPATDESSVEEVQSEEGGEEDAAPDEDGGEDEGDALKAMEKDAVAVSVYVKEAIYTYQAGIETTTWNGKTASEATVNDVCLKYNVDYSPEYYERTIGSDTYIMYFMTSKSEFEVHKSDEEVEGTVLTGTETIVELSGVELSEEDEEVDSLEAMEKDALAVTMYVKEAVNTYRAEIETTKWNGKTASEATVNDVCIANNIDYSSSFYKRTIGGESYTMFYNIGSLTFEVRKSDEQGDDVILLGSETIVSLSDENKAGN